MKPNPDYQPPLMVFIVSEHPSFLSIMSEHVRRFGHCPVPMRDTSIAHAQVRFMPPNYLLLDRRLPEFVLESFRAHPRIVTTPTTRLIECGEEDVQVAGDYLNIKGHLIPVQGRKF
jgi:hypothetical protein